MQKLGRFNTLIIHQAKRWGEILTGFDQKNKYSIIDESGNEVYQAGEEGGSFLLRMFLKGMRPFTLLVMNPDGSQVIKVKRPFRFIFHECDVFDNFGKNLGKVKAEWSIIRKKYIVFDSMGIEKYRLFAPALHPWTFQILQNDFEVGKIIKKWSGAMKEMFTDADNFGIQFPSDANVEIRGLLLGAVFLIDFVHFERKN